MSNIREFFEENLPTTWKFAMDYVARTIGIKERPLPMTREMRRAVDMEAAKQLARATNIISVRADDRIDFVRDFVKWAHRDNLVGVYMAQIELISDSKLIALVKEATIKPKSSNFTLELNKVMRVQSVANAVKFLCVDNFVQLDRRVTPIFYDRFTRAMKEALYDTVFFDHIGQDEMEFVKFCTMAQNEEQCRAILSNFLFDQINRLGNFAIPRTFSETIIECALIDAKKSRST